MRSCNSKGQVVHEPLDPPYENGISQKEPGRAGEEVQRVAKRVVEHVVKLASTDDRIRNSPPHAHRKGCDLKRLPTIQIDTVPSPPWSPVEEGEVVPPPEPPLQAEEIHLFLEDEPPQQSSSTDVEELRESLRSFIEDILSQAMVVAEKKLQFVGISDDEDDEDEEEEEPPPAPPEEAEPEEEPLSKEEEAEIRAAAEKVVEEVITMATEAVAVKLDEKNKDLDFQIKFDDAPDDVKDLASSLIKEIVGKAIALAEEKAVPTVPFNFEDVDLIKSSGPWYVRVREAFMRVLRTACFCTPRRNDS